MPRWLRSRNAFELQERSPIANMWLDRFGIPDTIFASYSFYRRAQNIWAFSNAALPNLSYEAVGLRMMNLKEKPWKPTTCALQIFGKHAIKNAINLNAKQARYFLAGNSQVLEAYAEPGYVVVLYEGEVLGCGLYSHGKLVSQLPKERRISDDMEMNM